MTLYYIVCICIHEINIKYPKALFKKWLSSENIGCTISKMYLGTLYSLGFFQTYTNFPIIYWKNTSIDFNLNLFYHLKISKIISWALHLPSVLVFCLNAVAMMYWKLCVSDVGASTILPTPTQSTPRSTINMIDQKRESKHTFHRGIR